MKVYSYATLCLPLLSMAGAKKYGALRKNNNDEPTDTISDPNLKAEIAALKMHKVDVDQDDLTAVNLIPDHPRITLPFKTDPDAAVEAVEDSDEGGDGRNLAVVWGCTDCWYDYWYGWVKACAYCGTYSGTCYSADYYNC